MENIDIKIYEAKPEDAFGINNLYYKTWLNTYPNKEYGVSEDDIRFMLKDSLSEESLDNQRKWLSDIPKDKKVCVAKNNEDIIGFCYVHKGLDSNNKLLAIYVDPNYHGMGVGKLMWNYMINFINQEKDTDVQVVAYNQSAIEFYKKIGFIDEGKRILDDEDYKMKSGTYLPIACLVRPKDFN